MDRAVPGLCWFLQRVTWVAAPASERLRTVGGGRLLAPRGRIGGRHGVLKSLWRDLADLEAQIVEMEGRLVVGWSGDTLSALRRTVTQYEEASLREICFLGKHAKARRNGEGERAGCTLASMLRRPWPSNYIVKLNDASGGRVAGSDGVLRVFTDFFAELYAGSPGLDPEAGSTTFPRSACCGLKTRIGPT
ncbi:hypothetical protein NDU88_005340 [Pleurodeles waltl]|uniref:Uncharacterized protein n=1 Tax=Pleurodeles waltl TaxID=8319 RepID=A0AAV7LMI0_PLEWA|nr:hypothetical protein NDU88_005340 [Pleurodeles waltl]